jgi:demethylmenaquinone methyltransferase / 2-methoxy-6-polyprenyl-1,4-benzoquinol methylase
MSNSYYEPGEQRAAKVHDLFSSIARRYDLINDLQSFGLHRRWKQQVISISKVKPGERTLDLCCGTGDLALRMAQAGALAYGLDFSLPMLEIARSRSRRIQPQVTFVQGDALRLPFEDSIFDAVTISYGLRNLADFEAGLREMLRVARPGGRLLVLDFGKPPNRLLRKAYFSYLKICVPAFGKIFCGDSAAYGYILESLRHYPGQEGVAELMRMIGCNGVSVVNLLGGVMSINYGEKGCARPAQLE